MNSSHKRQMFALSCVLLLGVLLLPMEAEAALGATPITVQSQVTLNAQPSEPMRLLGLTDRDGGETNLLTVSWEATQSGWFPVWQIVIRSEAGLIPDGKELRVSPVTPVDGHTYEAKLSYAPHTGALAFGLTDTDTNESLIKQGWRIGTYEGEVFASHLDHVMSVASWPWYEPIDLRWEIGTMDQDAFVPLQVIEPARRSYVRVTTQAPLTGEFRFLSDDGELIDAHTVHESEDGRLFLEIQPDTLPIGARTLSLQYVGDGEVRYSDARQIQVGRVDFDVSPAHFRREDELLEFALEMTSDSPLLNLGLDVQVTATQMVWNAELRKYEDQNSSTVRLEFDQIHVASQKVPIPVAIPAPKRPGAWRLDFSVTPTPSVDVRYVTRNAYFSTHDPAVIGSDDTYVVAVLPDTQYYAETYHDIYMRQTEWLSANAYERNIALVLHVGDITEDNYPYQWQVARDAHNLLDGVVPYVLSVGNHDYAPSGLVAARHTSRINEYFSFDDFAQLVGAMEPGRLENTYHQFSIGGTDYLVLSLEFAPADEVLVWANDVVADHPDHSVIVLTHGYLHPTRNRLASGASAQVFPMGENKETTMNDGDDMWAKFVSHHKNIAMVLSGHIHSDAIPHRVSIGRQGNRVHEILANYQAHDHGGNGFLVLLEFTPDGKVHASAYSPYLDEVKSGLDRYGNPSRFVIDLSADK